VRGRWGHTSGARPARSLEGVEAVIDKDLAAALIARDVAADVLLLLTDVPAVLADYGLPRNTHRQGDRRGASSDEFPGRIDGPKVEAACDS